MKINLKKIKSKFEIGNFLLFKKIKKKKKKRKRPRNKNHYQLRLNLQKKSYINLLIFIIIIILSIIFYLEKTDYFKIKDVNIVSYDGMSNTNFLNKKLVFLKGNLIFKINKEEIKNIILDLQPNIKKINISTSYPNKLNIDLFSYNGLFNTEINGKNYIIVENGTLIPTRTNFNNYPTIIIKNTEINKYPEYTKLFKNSNLKKIIYIKNSLEKNIVNLIINDVIYYKKEREIHFIINNNTRLIFDLEGDIQKKLEQIFVFNKEKLNIINPGIVYIDNRILGKIFYCTTDNIQQCIINLNYIYDENLKQSNFNIQIKK